MTLFNLYDINGGDVDANYNAALSILSRYKDPDISLYTPYKKVRYILEERFSQSSRWPMAIGTGVKTPLDLPPDEDWDGGSKGQSDSELLNV